MTTFDSSNHYRHWMISYFHMHGSTSHVNMLMSQFWMMLKLKHASLLQFAFQVKKRKQPKTRFSYMLAAGKTIPPHEVPTSYLWQSTNNINSVKSLLWKKEGGKWCRSTMKFLLWSWKKAAEAIEFGIWHHVVMDLSGRSPQKMRRTATVHSNSSLCSTGESEKKNRSKISSINHCVRS